MEQRKFTIAGKEFTLELALDDAHRFRGLSGRTSIPDGTGLMFVFKRPERRSFVMRDCPIPIDIIYIDATGRIASIHHMVAEPPRSASEQPDTPPYKDAPQETWFNTQYESRLVKYDSRFDACVVIEVAGGTINIDGKDKSGLVLKTGQKLDLDIGALRLLAK